jgi:Methylamine utilisation protein MauE
MTAVAVLVVAIRCALGLVLVAAGAAKSVAPRDFARTLRELTGGWANPRLARTTARLFAGAELTVGVIALSGMIPRPIDLAVLLLTVAFASAALYGHLTHPDTECRCFGSLIASQFDRASVGRALALAAAAGVIVVEDPLRAAGWTSSGAFSSSITLASATFFAIACAVASQAIEATGLRRRRGA